MKENRDFYFTVEGETEKLYLQWLQKTINVCESSLYRVSFKCKVEKNPSKYAKSLTVRSRSKVTVTHVFDYEGPQHDQEFRNMVKLVKMADKLKNGLAYKVGYNNLTFEVWLLLHKRSFVKPVIRQQEYLKLINETFNQSFEDMKAYQRVDNFGRLLENLTLDDVKQAVLYANRIMKRLKENAIEPQSAEGFCYYKENPSLSFHEQIEIILRTCGLV